MPAYNAEKTIKASIESIRDQTYRDWELIVVDDGSQDATPQIVKNVAEIDSRIRISINEHNIGAAATRNEGVTQAKGQWIAFLDSDDIWREDKLDKQLRFMKEHDAVISYTSTAYINEIGEMSNYVLRAKEKFSYKQLLWRNIMSCSSVVVRRDAMLPFAQGEMHEDYAVWLKILRGVKYAYGLDQPLLVYRVAANSKSSKRLRSAKMIRNTYRHVGYGKIAALLLTLRYMFHSISKRLFIRLGRLRHV